MSDGLDTAEVDGWKHQLQRDDFSGIRQYLARTRDARDWQDGCYCLNLLAPDIPLEPLTAACAAEPGAADLWLLLGLHSYGQLAQSRGSKTAEKTSEEQFREAEWHLHNMMISLPPVGSLTPDDPTPHVFAVRGLVVFSDNVDTLKREYAEAARLAPDCVPAHFAMVNARSRKWGGSHEEALHIARAAQSAWGAGSDLPACLFLAHFHVWQYARMFDRDKVQAERYLKNGAVRQELDRALDRWIGDSYRPRRSSLPYLHQAALWYDLCGDDVRLGRLLALTGPTPDDKVWGQIGDPRTTFSRAVQKAMSPGKAKTGILGWFQKGK